MKRAFLLGLAAAALIPAGSPAIAAPASKAPAAKDWTRVVVATPEGGFRVGNPAAATKLVEYGSLTCDHCARFAEVGVPQLLSKYVKSGRVSFEFRNFVRDPYDVTAALLSRCAGPANFFALTDSYFSGQKAWVGRFQGMTEAQAKALDALPPEQQFGQLASIGGLDAMAAKAGVAPTRAKQCLADKAGLDQLVAMRKVAVEKHKLQGTPTFVINGKTAEHAHDWTALEPLLGSPGG
jgi:protein-disulfide isomerase